MGLYNQAITVGTAQIIDLVSFGLFPGGGTFSLSTQSDGTALPASTFSIDSTGKLTIAAGASASSGTIPLKITDGSTTIIFAVSLVATASPPLSGDALANNLDGSGNSGIQQIFGYDGNDTLIGAAADDQLDGGEGNDSLTGNGGNDILDGNAGNDALNGGAGNDIYFVDGTGDVITEAAGNGTDVAYSTASAYTLSTEVENLYLLGGNSNNINGTGNILANRIVGNTGNNILDGAAGDDTLMGDAGNDSLNGGIGNDSLMGGTGNDTLNGGSGTDILAGGAGDDLYIVDNLTADTFTELTGEGTDTILFSTTDITITSANISSVSFVENLNVSGTTSFLTAITGNTINNVITGNVANNTIDGGGGADTMIGGAGNDTYAVDSTLDVVDETSNGGAGIDFVNSSVTYTLGANVEYLTLTGSGVINGTGNASANSITGNASANVLDGGAGADTLIGGGGNDTYTVDNIGDVVNGGTGTDLVNSSVTYSLATNALSANVENLTLTGTAANGTGNALTNILTANNATATANTLDGGAGADTLIGGAGNDIYIVDNAGDVVTEAANLGLDTIQSSVTYALGANVENLTLTGSAAINATGNALANNLTGNSGNNILTSGTDALVDTLIGGLGNDTYTIGTGDIVTEAANAGTDTIQSLLTYSLAALTNVENLDLSAGTTAINGTGNASANIITGNALANLLDGGAGADTLIGGTGNDIYTVDNIGDVVTETSSTLTEIDVVNSSATYTLGANIETLTLTGTLAINGTGNALANLITGNSGANILDGGTEGTAAADTLVGGAGDDTYIIGTGDIITESSPTGGTDTVSSGATVDLSLPAFANIENITLTGITAINGTGTAGNNIIKGDSNTAINTLTGLAGDDTYFVGTGDVVVEAASGGTDTVNSSVTYTLGSEVEKLILTTVGGAINGTGNGLVNTITGNASNNTLDGGAGADILIGGDGGDTYTVDNIGDVVTELATGTGTDVVSSSVTYTLGANIETLTLTGSTAINGTGNASINTINGNGGDNILSGGTDTLADTLVGGAGNDTYLFSTSDVITEATNAGTDTVNSAVNIDISSFANVENITLTGTTAINATGNGSDNVLKGDLNTAANVLTGGAGNDTYILGTGDTIAVDTAGTDSVQTSVTYTLSTDLENLTLTGTAAINGTGNASVNYIAGNSAANTLDGGAADDLLFGGVGKDSLTGGAGNDTFSYGTNRSGYSASLTDSLLANYDVITDFGASSAVDKFQAVVTPLSTVFAGGIVATLDQAGIQAKLTTATFNAYQAATFSFGSTNFVAINDGIAGFNALTDAVISIGTSTASITSANFILPWA